MEEGKYYHVYNRGINKEKIVKEEKNYFYFLQKYIEYTSEHVDTLAYCLMPTHFHFLVRVKTKDSQAGSFEKTSEVLAHKEEHSAVQTSDVGSQFLKTYPTSPLTPLEKGFKNFFTSYAKSINKKYRRNGSLFQNKFKRKEVDSTECLRNLISYIHFNPVKDVYVNKFEDWKFSSFTIFLNDEETIISRDEVLEIFNDKEDFLCFHNLSVANTFESVTKLESEIENIF